MDYQINVYPSSEKELQNIKAENAGRQIKIISDNKLPTLYKKSFGAAVKKHNERAISGRLIDDYYKSILSSNIPEVYRLSIIVRYELLNKVEIAAIQKAFADFKKAFEKESQLCLVSSFILTYDEYKEFLVFFYPISDGYVTGLATRNDLIDVTRKMVGTKDNFNIIKAIPMFTECMEKMFREVAGDQFLSQAEVEAIAKRIVEEDPMTVHAIAVETLKAQMNGLQKIHAENQALEAAVQKEKDRIQNDIVWSKEMETRIYKAEQERIETEQRLEAERIKAEKEAAAREAQRREEERLREEERRIEAERLADQARRNIEIRKQMAEEEAEAARRKLSRIAIDQDRLIELIDKHLTWQETYDITDEMEINNIPESALKDPRRLSLTSADISNIDLERTVTLIGAEFNNCEFASCKLSVELTATIIENCSFIYSSIEDTSLTKCMLTNVTLDRATMENIQIDDSTMMKMSLRGSLITGLFAAPATSFIRCNFAEATLRNCDMKKNAFINCNFFNTTVSACDMRDSVFQICKLENMIRELSMFKGAKIT